MNPIKNLNLKIKNCLILGFVLFAGFSFFIFNFKFVFAYTDTTDGGQLSAEVYPDAPGAYTSTTIHLVSYEVDLTRSTIIWTVNGKKQKEGIGQADLQFTTGPIGKKIVIDVEVISQDSTDITKKISIIPAETDLLWQSANSVPPFYKGKSLMGNQGKITLLAMPMFIAENGQTIKPSDLVYNWRLNSDNIDSGVGKNKEVINLTGNSYLNNISLDVSSLDGSIRASKLITFTPLQPGALFYASNPLLGPDYTRALGAIFEMRGTETTIRVEPYFFNNGGLNYAWSINDEIPVYSSKNDRPELTIRQSSSSAGESALNVLLNNSSYQSVLKSITIKFNQTTSRF